MMAIIDNAMLWRQFAVAIDALEDALRACPAELWEAHLWEDEPEQWVAHWARIERPDVIPIQGAQFPTWWHRKD